MAGPLEVFARLSKAYTELDWWPIDRAYHAANATDWRFEVVAGAILTQNTTWTILAMCWRTMDYVKEQMRAGNL